MAKPMIVKDYSDSYCIRIGGKKGKRWAPKGSLEGAYAIFATRAKAEKFIGEGNLVEVAIIPFPEASVTGWVEAEGYSDANLDRFSAWCKAEAVHYYAAPREEFFPRRGIEQAQKLGLTKVIMEDLS